MSQPFLVTLFYQGFGTYMVSQPFLHVTGDQGLLEMHAVTTHAAYAKIEAGAIFCEPAAILGFRVSLT